MSSVINEVIAPAAQARPPLSVAGLTPFTTIDFPGRLSCVLYLRGCPWRCSYCHNPELLSGGSRPEDRTWDSVFAFLQSRCGLLDAVVFSGGEPLLHPALPEVMQTVRAMGFSVGLHTTGALPQRLEALLPHLDWVGLDIKALPGDYADVVRRKVFLDGPWRSLDILTASGLTFECRTTVVWSKVTLARLRALAHLLAAKGVRRYALQHARLQECLDSELQEHQNVAPEQSEALFRELQELFEVFEVRGIAY